MRLNFMYPKMMLRFVIVITMFLFSPEVLAQSAWTCEVEGNDFDGKQLKASVISKKEYNGFNQQSGFPEKLKFEIFVIERWEDYEAVEMVIQGVDETTLPSKISIDGQVLLVNGRWAYGGYALGALEIVGSEEVTYLTTYGTLKRLKEGSRFLIRLSKGQLTQDYSFTLNGSNKAIECTIGDYDGFNKFN